MKYPEMREELLSHLSKLADEEYQRSCWVEGLCPDGIEHDELDYTIHFLFDDTELSSTPQSLIGVLLRNENEAKKVFRACS